MEEKERKKEKYFNLKKKKVAKGKEGVREGG